MTLSQSHYTQSMPARFWGVICIVLILGFVIASYHHHEGGTNLETCSLCILIDKFSGFFISEKPSFIQPTEFYILIAYYQILYSNYIQSFYHSRSPPF